jgi:hypothetical protein
MQPVFKDENGIIRFKPNAIVNHLLDRARIGLRTDLNVIGAMDFSVDDREQFAQLIGYSVSGFGDLSYVREETIIKADRLAAYFKEGHELST